MCILFLYANGCPEVGGYKLVIASNRDEFYARPARSAAQWDQCPHVFGGLDMEPGREGGTWLAISGKNKIIKVGALLNISGVPHKKNGLGRGNLVADYVKGEMSNEEYNDKLLLLTNIEDYGAFNMVSVEINKDQATIMHCSNAPMEKRIWTEGKPHGFGNSPPDQPFEKVKFGKKEFLKVLEEGKHDKNLIVSKCMELLKNRTEHWPDHEISKRVPAIGAKELSAINAVSLSAEYGSRTRTVIVVDSEDRMDFYEETMTTTDPKNGKWKKTHIFKQF